MTHAVAGRQGMAPSLGRARWVFRLLLRAAPCLLLAGSPVRADTDDGLEQFRGGLFAEALQSWRVAAETGDAEAALYLGVSYDTGQGVAPDPGQAVVWYRKAAERGSAPAMFNLAVLSGLGQGLPKDDAAALGWYLQAAEHSYPRAEYNLGLIYEDGIGTARDPVRAAMWFRAAARHGVTAARGHLAGLGARVAGAAEAAPGDQGLKKFQEAQAILLQRGPAAAHSAAVLLQSAAQSGNAMAAYDLGYCYENGLGVAKDPAEALHWYQRAAQASPDPALHAMAQAGLSALQPKPALEQFGLVRSSPSADRPGF